MAGLIAITKMPRITAWVTHD